MLLAFRLLGGVLAACSLTNSGGLINDIWASLDRGLPYATFTISPNLGPQLAPVISGFLTDRYGFRPSFWVLFAFSGVLLIMITFTLPETYPQFLLKQKVGITAKAHACLNQTTEDPRIRLHDYERRLVMTATGPSSIAKTGRFAPCSAKSSPDH